jgi:lipopolysaccharide biosynthesis glycosyltransferase
MLTSIKQNQIPVVASSDDNYAYPLGVMFISLLENTNNPERFSLFIIDGGIDSTKKEKLKNDIEQRGSTLTFLDINSDIYADFPTRAHISAPAYYRISIPELFESDVKKVIYLDCDLIIKSDLQLIWNIDLENYPIAAVENISKSTYKASQLNQSDYFNSGVMIINLDIWRKEKIPEQVRAFKIEHPELICTNDQCALNGVFKGNWKRLPLKWNHQSGLYRHSPQVQRFIDSGEYKEALWNPGIIHYVGWSKPWYSPCYHPLEGEYCRYKNLSLHASELLNEQKDWSHTLFSLLKKRIRQRLWQYRYKKNGFTLYSS